MRESFNKIVQIIIHICSVLIPKTCSPFSVAEMSFVEYIPNEWLLQSDKQMTDLFDDKHVNLKYILHTCNADKRMQKCGKYPSNYLRSVRFKRERKSEWEWERRRKMEFIKIYFLQALQFTNKFKQVSAEMNFSKKFTPLNVLR